ncbi:MAG: hypothetical protein V4687_15855 [Bacteroidota bacterium]
MVNQTNIFRKIGYILNELQDQYEFLSENPDQLSELELELFLANANFLSDHVQIVKKLNSSGPLNELPSPSPLADKSEDSRAHPELVQLEQVANTSFEFIIADDSSKVPESLEEIVTDNHHEEMIDYQVETAEEEVYSQETAAPPIVMDEDVEDEEGPEPFLVFKEAELSPEAQVIKDDVNVQEISDPIAEFIPDFKEEISVQAEVPAPRPSLNDLLASRLTNNINDDTAQPVVTDLKKAVNLNEKLLYIKDLFNGYNLAYSEAIDILNKLSDFKSADAFLKNNYAVKNNWGAKQGTVDKFYELLKQRFPEN